MIAAGILIVLFPDKGILVIAALFTLALAGYGLSNIIFYYSLARYMTGGKIILYLGVILLDFGIFTMTVSDKPEIYIILYLMIMHVFTGTVEILRMLEAKRLSSPSWKLSLSSGIVNIIVGIAAFVMGAVFGSTNAIVYIYCAGIFYSAAIRIINSFRKTAMVYIQ